MKTWHANNLDTRKILLSVDNLVKHFPVTEGIIRQRNGAVHAVDGVSFFIRRGETLGLVGESGCGKSTTGRTILQLHRPTSGSVGLEGVDLVKASDETLQKMRCRMQMIFQDPYASLNPRKTAGEIIAEPLVVHHVIDRMEINDWIDNLLLLVGLEPSFASRYPYEFTAGQQLRIGIARSLALHPSLIICDEPVATLNISMQVQIVNLLRDLQEEFELAYLFTAHDFLMIRHISDRVAVMHLGTIVELADCYELYSRPLHPYTGTLLSAVQPSPVVLRTDRSAHIHPPTGCRFHARCPLAKPVCFEEFPALREVAPGHYVRCHLM